MNAAVGLVMFPSLGPNITQGAVQGIKVWPVVMMCNWRLWSFSLPLQSFPCTVSQQHLCLLRWRTILEGKQGVRGKWPITFVQEAQPFRYDTVKPGFTPCCFLSVVRFLLLHLIHLCPQQEEELCRIWLRFFCLCARGVVRLLYFVWCCVVLSAYVRGEKRLCGIPVIGTKLHWVDFT